MAKGLRFELLGHDLVGIEWSDCRCAGNRKMIGLHQGGKFVVGVDGGTGGRDEGGGIGRGGSGRGGSDIWVVFDIDRIGFSFDGDFVAGAGVENGVQRGSVGGGFG